MYRTIYTFTPQNAASTICKNQSVQLLVKSNCVQVISEQCFSTPGLRVCTPFQIYKDVQYTLSATGFSSRPSLAFLWVMNEAKQRLTTSYTYLDSSSSSTVQYCFTAPRTEKVYIGVLMTSPQLNDSFNIYALNFQESCSHPTTTTTTTPCSTASNTCQYTYPLTTQEPQFSTPYCNGINPPQPVQASMCSTLFKHCEPLYVDYERLIQFTNSLFVENINYNTSVAAGFTFLAEFMRNDITFLMDRPGNIIRLNLQSVYGHDEKYLFSKDKFLINKYHDLNRTKSGCAIIPDNRNDSSYVISQLHLLFQLFHNKLIKKYKATKANVYSYVKQEVIRYYQWIILNDFLPRLVDHDILESIKSGGVKFVKERTVACEFLKAVLLYPQFTVKPTYKIAKDLVIDACHLSTYTGGHLPKYIINWNLFFNLATSSPPQPSKAIDMFIVEDLKPIEGTAPAILKDLTSGQEFNLCSGQNISAAMSLKPIPADILRQFDPSKSLERNNLLEHTPLLIYALLESKVYTNGERFTGVGGILLAESIFTILCNDQTSILNNNWKPKIGISTSFSIADLIKFVYSDC